MRNTLRKLIYPLVPALLFLVSSANASGVHRFSSTQEDKWTAIKTDAGILFVWNREGLHFTLAVKGNQIRPIEHPDNIFFNVDGRMFQIQSLPISNFAPDARKNKLDDKSILLAHRDWESEFLQNELLHSKVTVRSSNEKLTSGADVLVWAYDLPDQFKNPDAKTQMYLSIVAKDYVILLNSVVSATGSEDSVRKFLLETIKTLKLSNDPIDVDKLQEAIRKGTEP
jgi:hypothetical protein